MQIGGFLPLSLCDFPGKVSSVVFTQGCNFRCPFCHNHGLIEGKPAIAITVDDILQDLEERSGFVDGVVISGGEPTLHADLKDLIVKIRSLGLAIKLDTNGSRPEVLRELLESRLLDYVAMDVKASFDRYEILAGVPIDVQVIRESIAIISEAGIPCQFRTTHVPALLSTDELATIQGCLPAGCSLHIQKCQPEHALNPTMCNQ